MSSLNFRGKAFLPQNIYIYIWKINKMPEFYMILARKISKIPEFVWYLPEKWTKFSNFTWLLPENARIYIKIARKIFFRIFFWGGEHMPPWPPSSTPMRLDFSRGGFLGGSTPKKPTGYFLGMYPITHVSVWTLPGVDISLCTCKILKMPDTGQLPVSVNLLVIYR